MGFVTNKWQPVSAGPGPTPVPTWEKIKQNVNCTTAFDYSALDYTEYLVLIKHKDNTNTCCEFFYSPVFGTTTQIGGYTNVMIYLYPQNTSKLQFTIYNTRHSTTTTNYRYTVYGRKKAPWTAVTRATPYALPDYTELAVNINYYTPFKYQESYYNVGGGTTYASSSPYRPSFAGQIQQVFNNQYNGNGTVYTRLSTNEANWNHITSTSATVSIADISYSEMFITSRRMQHQYGGSNQRTFQSLYVIPEMPKGRYCAGGYTGFYSSYTNRYDGSYGYIEISDSSVSAYCSINSSGYANNTFEQLDIYYR